MKIKKIAATEQHIRKKKVAAYCRVSTGRTEQEESLETQQDYYSRYIMGNTEWEYAGVYSDARSGLSAEKRPGFLKLIRDAIDGKIDIILCKSISRFSRNIIECQRYTSQLSSKNVTVVFEKEHLRTDEPTSNLIFSLMCAIAQDESRSISENMKTAIRHKVEAGEYTPHQNLILGYDVRDGKYVTNRDARIIEIIFRLYASGVGMSDICQRLNSLGFPRKLVGKPFEHQIIRRILTNETYVGDKKLQKEAPKDFITKRPDNTRKYSTNYLTDDHEAIVPRDIWDQVQHRIEKEAEERNQGVHHQWWSHEYYGKIYCGLCGAPYQRRMKNTNSSAPGAPRYIQVWGCKERLKGKKGNGCKNVIIKEEILEQAFLAHPGEQLIIKGELIESKKAQPC